MRISDWSSDVCSSDLAVRKVAVRRGDLHRLDARLRLLGQPRAIGVEAPVAQARTHRESEDIVGVAMPGAREIDMDLRNTARLQLGGQCRAAAFELLYAARAEAAEQDRQSGV